jgi:hypothetical protein
MPNFCREPTARHVDVAKRISYIGSSSAKLLRPTPSRSRELMPAVEYGRCHHRARRSEVPVQIRVQEDRVEVSAGAVLSVTSGLNPEQQAPASLGPSRSKDRSPDAPADRRASRRSSELRWTAWDGHQRAAVETPDASSIRDQIDQGVHLDRLQPERLATQRVQSRGQRPAFNASNGGSRRPQSAGWPQHDGQVRPDRSGLVISTVTNQSPHP